MIFTCLKRIVDGLLTWPDVAPEHTLDEDQARRQTEAASLFGGTAADYTFIELSPAQYAAVVAAMPGRSFLIDGAVISKLPPTLTANKSTVIADGVDTATITAQVSDPACTDILKWTVYVPDGSLVQGQENLIAGAAVLELQTSALGLHRISAESEQWGIAASAVEGI
ncbi:MAG TPA: hypothetical protein VHP83_21385 [Aggregatilineaceae bacterium]|nr:hypothetical protein [Aggregatilineaceae bacterium]